MILTKDMIFTVLLFFGIGKYSELNDPKYYEMMDANGQIHYVQITKEKNFSCPAHCSINHYHKTLIKTNDMIETNNYFINNFGNNEMKLNSYEIVYFETIKRDKKPGKSILKFK